MATINTPSRKYNIDNCVVGELAEDTQGKTHPNNFNDRPDLFYMELLGNTRTGIECPSDNNPVTMNITGIIK